MAYPESPNRILLACFLGVAVFGLLTAKDMIVTHLENKAGQPEPVAVTVDQPDQSCIGWEETDTVDTVQLKLDLCRASLKLNQEKLRWLNEQAHDEFDQDAP